MNNDSRQFFAALPFWMSLLMVPLAVFSALLGGIWVFLLPLSSWGLFSIIDVFSGLNSSNMDPDTPEDQLFWYKAITAIWFPVQLVLVLWMVWYIPQAAHLGFWEKCGLVFGIGVLTGTIGINYSHELMHQKSSYERWSADLLLAMVFYSHFRSEHLLVHHRYVATPRDPVTARYNEGFHRFFARVLWQCYRSAFRAEAAMLARKKRPWYDPSNPFWRYWGLQAAVMSAAIILGGGQGAIIVFAQAFVAIWQLELVNYVEHYGLTRKYLGDGKYEHTQPHHSWNANHRASSWLLINLQRHSDHHYKPNRRFPLLQTYQADQAPQMPYSYPVMTVLAMVPPVWRRVMNAKVRNWRRLHYPDVQDWKPYKNATNPWPN